VNAPQDSSDSLIAQGTDQSNPVNEIERLGNQFAEARKAVASIIFGQGAVVEQALTAILAGGHVLLIGVPGLGKTLLVETLGRVLGLTERRVQFTPDLMPADILGSEILEESESGKRSFRFIKGPIFTQLLMADEINRASPRTQSALLQGMQESRVSIAGEYHKLPHPFHVLATQNPLEQEGTYPLPEAQLDRFLMQIDVRYPEREAERDILLHTTGNGTNRAPQVFTAIELQAAQAAVRQIPVGESVVEAILNLVRSGRPEDTEIDDIRRYVAWGPSPRASQAIMMAVRAHAALDGRSAPSVDDVIALAKPILRHRMALHFSARSEGLTVDGLIERICEDL